MFLKTRPLFLGVICEDICASHDLIYSMIGPVHPGGKAPSLNFCYGQFLQMMCPAVLLG